MELGPQAAAEESDEAGEAVVPGALVGEES